MREVHIVVRERVNWVRGGYNCCFKKSKVFFSTVDDAYLSRLSVRSSSDFFATPPPITPQSMSYSVWYSRVTQKWLTVA